MNIFWVDVEIVVSVGSLVLMNDGEGVKNFMNVDTSGSTAWPLEIHDLPASNHSYIGTAASSALHVNIVPVGAGSFAEGNARIILNVCHRFL